ncbi:hypothetical protein CCH79_00009767 [Gambusia affinis]|uniref:Extended synaptotagmin-like protein 2a n=1 Tax=Gambusia affinis TaxID=33528 RepID=A0A315W2C9_GAMAF|nr:hypothetical protein CCH79_00009767 [Gambusia affinis]
MLMNWMKLTWGQKKNRPLKVGRADCGMPVSRRKTSRKSGDFNAHRRGFLKPETTATAGAMLTAGCDVVYGRTGEGGTHPVSSRRSCDLTRDGWLEHCELRLKRMASLTRTATALRMKERKRLRGGADDIIIIIIIISYVDVYSSIWKSEQKPKLSCGHRQGKCDVESGGNPGAAESLRRDDKFPSLKREASPAPRSHTCEETASLLSKCGSKFIGRKDCCSFVPPAGPLGKRASFPDPQREQLQSLHLNPSSESVVTQTTESPSSPIYPFRQAATKTHNPPHTLVGTHFNRDLALRNQRNTEQQIIISSWRNPTCIAANAAGGYSYETQCQNFKLLQSKLLNMLLLGNQRVSELLASLFSAMFSLLAASVAAFHRPMPALSVCLCGVPKRCHHPIRAFCPRTTPYPCENTVKSSPVSHCQKCLYSEEMSNSMEGAAGPGTRANGPVPAPNADQVPPSPGLPLAPEELVEEQPSSLTDVSQMWIKFAKTFAVIFPIYVLGYFEFSFSWVLIGLAMLFYWRKNHGSKDYRINRALAFLDHKDTTAKQSLPATELPPWEFICIPQFDLNTVLRLRRVGAADTSVERTDEVVQIQCPLYDSRWTGEGGRHAANVVGSGSRTHDSRIEDSMPLNMGCSIPCATTARPLILFIIQMWSEWSGSISTHRHPPITPHGLLLPSQSGEKGLKGSEPGALRDLVPTVKQMWPFICQFVDKLFRETIEPAVKGANPHLSTFCFTKIDMGDKPLRVNGVKVYTENVDKRQVIMDLQISFVGNTEIDIDIKKFYCRAGIKSIQLHGMLRVVMEPLLGDMPLIGALSVFFLNKPMLDINWTGLTNMLDIPGVNGLCDGLIQDIIYSYLVLPNRLNIPLVGEAELARIRFPIPEAVVRIHFIEAQDLVGKDKFLGGLIKGKSDPYGVIRLGPQEVKSKVINENLNPRWNEVHEFLMYDNTAKTMEIVLFDEDPDEDDKLGNVMIDMSELKKEQIVEEWFNLEDVPKGKLHLKMEWLCLLPSPDKLDQALLQVRADGSRSTDGLSSAVLIVFLDSARNLPSVFEGNLGSGYLKERRSAGLVFCENTSSLYRTLFRNPLEFNQTGLRKASISKAIKSGKKVTSDPSPLVQFRVGHKSFDSKTKYKTTEPVWEENFTFLIHNPKLQELQVEVKDAKHECSLGTLALPLTRLLEAENMTLSQRFPLKNSGPSCTLKMKMALRVLSLEKTPTSPSNSTPSSIQVRKSSSSTPRPSVSSEASMPPSSISDVPRSSTASVQDLSTRRKESEPPVKSLGSVDLEHAGVGRGAGGQSLAETGKSTSYLAISGSQQFLNGGKEPTPSIASDISNPYAAQELHQRLQQLPNGSDSSPLGSIQLTIRYSTQRNRLIVVVHSCRNLIAFTDHGSNPYARLYLHPDKRRSGRRKTHTHKKTQNPHFDETFEFSVTWIELSNRSLDVAVKNSGGLLSKHKGLLGKVSVDLNHEDITKAFLMVVEGECVWVCVCVCVCVRAVEPKRREKHSCYDEIRPLPSVTFLELNLKPVKFGRRSKNVVFFIHLTCSAQQHVGEVHAALTPIRCFRLCSIVFCKKRNDLLETVGFEKPLRLMLSCKGGSSPPSF